MPTATLRPNNDFNTGWSFSNSSLWGSVDEETPNGDIDYVYTDAYSISQLFNLTDSGLSGATIDKVTVYISARRTTSNTTTIRIRIRTHGSTFQGSVHTLTNDYVEYSDEWTNNPYTGEAWTIQEVDDLIAGVNSTGQTQMKRVTAVWVIVTYTSGGQTYTKTWATDALFKKLGITRTSAIEMALQKQNIPKTFDVDAAFLATVYVQRQTDVLFKKLDALKTFGVDVDFLKRDVIKGFAVDARFGSVVTYAISKQIDVLFEKLGVARTFGIDACFGAVEAVAYIRSLALDVVFAFKMRLPEIWLDEEGKIVLNISRPYVWVRD